MLSTPVTAIEYGTAGVRVRAGRQAFAAARCAVAVPLPALRRMTFSPRLPAVLRGAINEVQIRRGDQGPPPVLAP